MPMGLVKYSQRKFEGGWGPFDAGARSTVAQAHASNPIKKGARQTFFASSIGHLGSNRSVAAIHHQMRSGNKRRLVGGQEEDGVGDLACRPGAPQKGLGAFLGVKLLK